RRHPPPLSSSPQGPTRLPYSHISNRPADPFPSLLGKVAPQGVERRPSFGWGVARCFGPSRIAPPPPRTFVGPYLLSAPHPAFGRPPRFAEKGKPATASSSMKSIANSTCVNTVPTRGEEFAFARLPYLWRARALTKPA